jgi:hypothetical protein
MQRWSEWTEITDENLEKVPKKKGVYQLRTNLPIKRLKGETDILYIGCGDFYDRLSCFEELEDVKKDDIWLHDVRPRLRNYIKNFPDAKVEFRFIITDKYEEYEGDLLDEFEKKHLELPPFNRIK